jgi:CheY-like chemotaxis protein
MQKKAIICVDDEKIILVSLKSQLKKLFGNDYQLEFAEEATEAFEIIEELAAAQVEIIMVVSDWLMPGMKGDEFLIKIHDKYPGIISILLTGQADEKAIQQAKEKAHLFCCLQKPWTEEELFEKLSSGLKKLD